MSIEIRVPELGESVLSATIHQWFKSEGERVAVGEALVELETDKVNLEVGSERAGILARIDHQAGEDVEVGDVLGMIQEDVDNEDQSSDGEEKPGSDESPPTKSKKAEPVSGSTSSPERNDAGGREQPSPASPLAERIAREYGVSLAEIQGSGSGGRVLKEDVERFIQRQTPSAEASEAEQPARSTAQAAPGEQDAPPTHRREERQKMSRRRRTIANRLVEAQATAAMLTTFNEIDMGAVMDLRKRRNPGFQERYGVKLGITSFFIKASVGALKAFPRLNAEVDGDEMLLKYYYDIGVAIGDPEGLVVPVVRDAERLSFAQIETQIRDFALKAQEKRLALDDLRGGTFSITNGGVYGSMLSTPILNPPQVGILGLHKIESRPVVVDSQMVIRPMMYVALTYDHRIVDGREAVQFLVRVKELVEDPETLLLES